MRGRRHAVEIECGDVGGVLEDRAELVRQALDLPVVRAARRASIATCSTSCRVIAAPRSLMRASLARHPARPDTIRAVAKHLFLSDEWFAAVDQLFTEHGAAAPSNVAVIVNVTVTDTPFGAERHLHLGATDGRGHWGFGHSDDADVSLDDRLRDRSRGAAQR